MVLVLFFTSQSVCLYIIVSCIFSSWIFFSVAVFLSLSFKSIYILQIFIKTHYLTNSKCVAQLFDIYFSEINIIFYKKVEELSQEKLLSKKVIEVFMALRLPVSNSDLKNCLFYFIKNYFFYKIFSLLV